MREEQLLLQGEAAAVMGAGAARRLPPCTRAGLHWGAAHAPASDTLPPVPAGGQLLSYYSHLQRRKMDPARVEARKRHRNDRKEAERLAQLQAGGS